MLIDYNMSKSYCSEWSAIDAIREMVQNAIDSGSEYSCAIEDYITVTTKATTLPLDTLVIGQSVKNNNAIGKYGEGYKIGMLVLTRESLLPSITTNEYVITGLFSSNQFDIETFKIQIEHNCTHSNDITFKCQLGNIDIDELKRKIPAFTGKQPPLPSTIDVWHHRPGEIFVNGLYVTQADLVFGYNFAPNFITLNRDRNMAQDVYWVLAGFYARLGKSHAETIFNLIEQEAPDVRDLGYRLHDENLKAELAKLFRAKYGNETTIAKPGTTYFTSGTVSVGATAAKVYSSCGIPEVSKTIDPDAPSQVLTTWLNKNRNKLRRDIRNSLSKIITVSKGWSKSDIY